jgi:hypothetical protein
VVAVCPDAEGGDARVVRDFLGAGHLQRPVHDVLLVPVSNQRLREKSRRELNGII